MTVDMGSSIDLAAVLQLSTRATQFSYSYACDVKCVLKIQKRYLRAVSALTEVLLSLKQAILNAESAGAAPVYPSLNGVILTDCYTELTLLYSDLQKRRLGYLPPFQDMELKPHVNMLRKFRALFTDFLSHITVITKRTYEEPSLLNQERDRNVLLTCVPSMSVPLWQRPSPLPGTGAWLLASEAVQEWIHCSSKLLWCHGPPGVGKSFLASVVADHLLERRTQGDFLVAYFFFDFSSQDQQKLLDILHHILRQLIDQGNSETLTTLKVACEDPSILLSAQKVVQLISRVGSAQQVYLILDALDEIKAQNEFLGHILTLVESGTQVLLTSRDLVSIRQKMNSASQVQIQADKSDLEFYIRSRLLESSSEIAKDKILVEDIVSKAYNSFLLAHLMLDELLDLPTVDQIHRLLQRRPQNLQKALEATMERIDSQSEDRKSLGRRLLTWVVYAKRRLTLEEISSAFSIRNGEDEKLNFLASPNLLLQLCAGMVILNKSDNTFSLIHTSAFEFLSGILPEKDANIDIARTCLQYLLSETRMQRLCESSDEMMERFNTSPFLRYSAKHWGQHLSDEGLQKSLEPVIMRFLGDRKLRSSAFQALRFQQQAPSDILTDEMFHLLPSHQEALHLAIYWNLDHIVKKLLETGSSISVIDTQKQTSLHLACSNNNFAAAEQLILHGADINAQDIQGWTPLIHSAMIGNLDLVRLLTSIGVNHLIWSKLGWTALHWAISGGHYTIVQELLEYHSQSQMLEPVLQRMTFEEIKSYTQATLPVLIAADAEDVDIFSSVIRHLETPDKKVEKAQFNMIWAQRNLDVPPWPVSENNPWRGISRQEQCNGREEELGILKFIGSYAVCSKRSPSDPEWKSILLLCAIRDEQLSLVQMLIKAGADVNYKNALRAAACRKDPHYVQCLLENGADPNAVDGCGRTALHEAVMYGFLDTTSALIDGGADVNQSVDRESGAELGGGFNRGCCVIYTDGYDFRITEKGATTLMQACGFLLHDLKRTQAPKPELTLPMVRLLLSKGADPRLTDASGRTVLHYAVLRPYLPLIRLLVESGSLVDAVDQSGRTILHYLARCQESNFETCDLEEIVCILLEASQAYPFKTLLNQLPSSIGTGDQNEKRSIVRKINEEHGRIVKVEQLDDMLTPLKLAIYAHRFKIFQIFVAHGANFSTNLDLKSILCYAVEKLDADAVDLLLSHGACPSETAVMELVDSFISQWVDGEPPEDDSYARFKRILRGIVLAGADINPCLLDTAEVKETPLTVTAGVPGSRKALQDLLNFGADVYSVSSRTFDPILTAALFGENEDIICLLNHTALHPNPNHWSRFLKDIPISNNHILRICLCLQRAGAVNSTNKQGRTLLHLAAEQGNTWLMAALISCNAELDIADNNSLLAMHCAGFSQQTAGLLMLFPLSIDALLKENIRLSLKERQSVIQGVLKRKDPSNMSMFDIAALGNDLSLASLLLQLRFSPNLWLHRRWQHRCRPIYHAAEHGWGEMVSLFLSHHADIEATDEYGWRALHVACYQGHTDIVRILIEAGANVHAETTSWNNRDSRPTGLYQGNRWRGTPLHLAAMGGHVDIVKLLLEKNVDVHASTLVNNRFNNRLFQCPDHGPTALHLVLNTGTFYSYQGQSLSAARLEIAQMLVDRGAMVQKIIGKFYLEQILKFRNFPKLWDSLVAGDSSS